MGRTAPAAATALRKARTFGYSGKSRAGIETAVDVIGDSNDNALAQMVIDLLKTDIFHRCLPWRFFEAVELATLERGGRFN